MANPLHRVMAFVIKPLLRQPDVGWPPGAQERGPNMWAFLSLFCAILPVLILAIIIFAEIVDVEQVRRTVVVGQLAVALIALFGAVCGAVGAYRYWSSPRRGGLRATIFGLVGCGLWALYFRRIVEAILSTM